MMEAQQGNSREEKHPFNKKRIIKTLRRRWFVYQMNKLDGKIKISCKENIWE